MSELIERIDDILGDFELNPAKIIITLRLCKAALSQQEAIDKETALAAITAGYHITDDMPLATRSFIAGYKACRGESQQKVELKMPQDVEAFIAAKAESGDYAHNFDMAISTDDLRAWMSGHARVRVEPTDKMIDAGVAMALQVSVHGQGGWSNYVRDLYKQMLAASQEGV